MKTYRQRLIAGIHAEKRKHGMDDETYRDMLRRFAAEHGQDGTDSCKHLCTKALWSVLCHLGGIPAKTRKGGGLQDPQDAKMWAAALEVLSEKNDCREPKSSEVASYLQGIANRMARGVAWRDADGRTKRSMIAALEYERTGQNGAKTRLRPKRKAAGRRSRGE